LIRIINWKEQVSTRSRRVRTFIRLGEKRNLRRNKRKRKTGGFSQQKKLLRFFYK